MIHCAHSFPPDLIGAPCMRCGGRFPFPSEPAGRPDVHAVIRLTESAARCRCWVGNPVPRWYGPLVVLLLLVIAGLVLSGCFVAPTDPVTCTGTRAMVCDCADSCISRKDDVLVIADPSCTGVTVCWTPDGGR